MQKVENFRLPTSAFPFFYLDTEDEGKFVAKGEGIASGVVAVLTLRPVVSEAECCFVGFLTCTELIR